MRASEVKGAMSFVNVARRIIGILFIVTGLALGFWCLMSFFKIDIYFLPRANPLAKDTVYLLFASIISLALVASGIGKIWLSK